MRTLLKLLLLCAFLAPIAFAQNTNIPNMSVSHYTTDPTGNGCGPNQFAMNDTASGTFYGCYSNAYAKIGGGAPSGPAGGCAISGNYPSPTPGQCVAPNQNVIYASPNCGTQTNCYPVYADAHFVSDATSANTSQTITCPNGDCNFTGTDAFGRPIAVTGEKVFGTSDPLNGTLDVPVGTISAINSASSITVSLAATANHTANLYLFWGHDDTTRLSAFGTATGNACARGMISGGYMFTSTAQFLSEVSANCSGLPGATYQGMSIVGSGINMTWLMPTPDFDFSTCTGGASGKACFFGTYSGEISNLSIWGGGYSVGSTHDKILLEVANASRISLVNGMGFGATTTSLVGIQSDSVNGEFRSGGSIDFGITSCQINATDVLFIGNYCFSAAGHGLNVLASKSLYSLDNTYATGASSLEAVYDQGTLWMNGDTVTPAHGSSGINVLGTGKLYLSNTNANSGTALTGTTGVYLSVTGAKAYLSGSIIGGGTVAGSPFFTVSGSTLVDLGGNTLTAGGSGHILDNVSGKASGPGWDLDLGTFIVSALPTASIFSAGTRLTVTDASSFTVGSCTGSGSDIMIAISDGASGYSCH